MRVDRIQSSLGIATLRNNRIVRANQRLADLFGYSQDELAGREGCAMCSVRFSGANREMAEECEFPYSAQCGSFSDDLQFRHRDGGLWRGRCGFMARHDDHPDGEAVWVVEELPASQGSRLRADDKDLRLIADNVPAMISYVDSHARLRYANARLRKFMGLREGDIGQSLWELMRPSSREFLKEPIAAALGGQPTRYERQAQQKDGEVRHIETRLIPDMAPDGSVAGYYALGVDVTEHRQAVAAARLNSSLLEGAHEGIMITDRDNLILSVNRAFSEITGYSADEVIGRNPHILKSGMQSAAFYEAMWDSIAETGRWQGEVWDRRKDGQVYCERLSIISVSDESGALTHYCAIFSDITALKAMEAELRNNNAVLEDRVRERTAELERVNRELETFSSMVSHDLRAPLRHITGFSSLVLEANQGKLDAASVGYLNRIRAAGTRMEQLITELLALAHVSRTDMNAQAVDLSRLAGEVAGALLPEYSAAPVQIVVQPDMAVIGDPGLLRIVLENLIGNACKFASRVIEPRIAIGCEQLDGEMIYFVRDNGAGFDGQHAHRLFEPFARLHSALEFEGNGIGLSIVKRIVARHGGRIWADGAVGQGATFRFTLG